MVRKEEAIEEYANMAGNDGAPVSPVSLGPLTWPPAWLQTLEDSSATPQANACNSEAQGWRLPSGAVICARCNRRPDDAVPVAMAVGPNGPYWVDAASTGSVAPLAPPPPLPPSQSFGQPETVAESHPFQTATDRPVDTANLSWR